MSSKKYLDKAGLTYFWEKIKSAISDAIPTKTSDLTNDSNYVTDASYVHTDNNYTTTEKNKLAGVASGAEVNVQSDWNVTDNTSDAYIANKPSIPPGAMVVNITSTVHGDGSVTWSADKTYAQILAYINAGGVVYVKDDDLYIYSLIGIDDVYEGIIFAYEEIMSIETGSDSNIIRQFLYFIDSSNEIRWMESGWSNANTLVTDFASSSTPLMNGTAAVGSSTNYARADHVHPSDTNKADVSTVLTKTNTTSYTPTANYHPATKKYVDDSVSSFSTNLSGLTDTTISNPSNGQVLTYNGSQWINSTISNPDIPSPDWDEDDSTDVDYISNRPAIRAGTGANSIVEGHVEDESDAATYTIYVTGAASATDYTYTTEDTLPTPANLRAYAIAYCTTKDKYVRIITCKDGKLSVVPSFSSTALNNEEITIFYKYKSIALGDGSHAEGWSWAMENYSHSEGASNFALGLYSHAEGRRTTASGTYSHSEGESTVARGNFSHAEGGNTTAIGTYSHTEGFRTKTNSNSSGAHAEGRYSSASQYGSHAEGYEVTYSITFSGSANATSFNITSSTKPLVYNTEMASSCHLYYKSNTYEVSGLTISNNRLTDFTLTQPLSTEALTNVSANFFIGTWARGSGTHVEGAATAAYSDYAHAEGKQSFAISEGAHAEGEGTIARAQSSHAQGKFNIDDSSQQYAHIVGNGTSPDARSNAHTLDWSGNGWYAGKLTVGAAPTNNMDVATKQYVDSAVGGITDTNTTYTISISGNVISLTPSSGQAQTITLPVYDGSVSSS